jgi:hypothetical protein
MEVNLSYLLSLLGYGGRQKLVSVVARIQGKPKLFSVIIRIRPKTQIIYLPSLRMVGKIKTSCHC